MRKGDRLTHVFDSVRVDSGFSDHHSKGKLASKFAKSTKCLLFPFKHLFAICVGLSIAHGASDGKSTKFIMDQSEAVLGKERIAWSFKKAYEGARYIGKGWLGISKEIDRRYSTASLFLPVAPPPGKAGLTVTSIGGAVEGEVHNAMAKKVEEEAKIPPLPPPPGKIP